MSIPVEDRNMRIGTLLEGRYGGDAFRCTYARNKEGSPVFRLEDGREFFSISGAGRACRGGKSTDGFAFFTIVTRGRGDLIEGTPYVARPRKPKDGEDGSAASEPTRQGDGDATDAEAPRALDPSII